MTASALVTRRPISVAIVDDESSVRTAVRRLCVAFGLHATTYGSGREFLESLDAGASPPDCIILDTQMPEMTGLEVQRHLLARGPRLPTVVVTADDAPEARDRYLAAGVAEYLRKPVDGDDLLAAIGRALAAAARGGSIVDAPARDTRQ